jgi:hypothetical protein
MIVTLPYNQGGENFPLIPPGGETTLEGIRWTASAELRELLEPKKKIEAIALDLDSGQTNVFAILGVRVGGVPIFKTPLITPVPITNGQGRTRVHLESGRGYERLHYDGTHIDGFELVLRNRLSMPLAVHGWVIARVIGE